jgi:hypothetical protein
MTDDKGGGKPTDKPMDDKGGGKPTDDKGGYQKQ